jgi:sugar lactone lactonase YvrE
LITGVLAAVPANAWERGTVEVLHELPNLIGQATSALKSSVEGITVGSNGNIYAASSGYNNGITATPTAANLFTITPQGTIPVLGGQITIKNSSANILGIGFNPLTTCCAELWAVDNGNSTVLRVTLGTGDTSVLAGPFPGAFLNALTFDKFGNAYVSDSALGKIYKILPSGQGVQSITLLTWITDPLLQPALGLQPPVGANGVALNKDQTILFVANTANRQIIQIPINPNGTARTPTVFVNGINGPDGIAIDNNDNIWACANQADEIVVLDNTGKVIAKHGDFHGIETARVRLGNIVKGLLFPASLAFSPDQKTLYVSNLASARAAPNLTIDSGWASQVTRFTVSKLAATIPPLR